MPLVAITVGAAVAVSWLRGGRLSRLGEAELRWSWLLFAGLALQILLDQAAGRGVLDDGYVLLAASQVLVLVWVLGNWWRPGMLLVGVGLAMNAVVIAANGAMPVDPDAIAALGLPGAAVPAGKHVLMTDATRFAWMADVIPLPPVRTIISWGDVVLAAGLIPLVHHLMTYRSPAERRGGVRRAVGSAA